jgi:Ser/Thr protein kinase RdoA (MazF antagonist)
MSMTYKPKSQNSADIQKIWNFFAQGKVLQFHILPQMSSLKILFHLQTTKGSYKLTGYARLEKKQLENVIYCKNIFAVQGIPLPLPLASGKNCFYEDKKMYWYIVPWIEGQVLTPDQISLAQINKIARILAKIHKFRFKLPHALPVLRDKVPDVSVPGCAKECKNWQHHFTQHAWLIKENLVCSHGDLLPQNVVWTTPQTAFLIDWDNAGLINQDIDLFNTAINWAGIESGKLNKKHYCYFIESYLKENPRPIKLDHALIAASLGSWLNWLIFNQENGHTETVDTTLKVLHILEQEFLS